MSDNYTYPLDINWSTDEITSVLSFLNQVEKAYEAKVEASQLLQSYATFKKLYLANHKKSRLIGIFKKVVVIRLIR